MSPWSRPVERLREKLRQSLPSPGALSAFASKLALASLASRVVCLVLAATLLTSLVVTWVSTESIQSFLREKIDQKFPVILSAAEERLQLWYREQEMDVETFARSDIIRLNLARLRSGARGQKTRQAHQEVSDYLSLILERLPQARGLFILDRSGHRLAKIGDVPEFPETLIENLAGVEQPAVSDIYKLDGRVQIASAPVLSPSNRRSGSLHAVLRVAAVDELLRSERLGASGTVFLVARDGTYLTPAGDTLPGATYSRTLPESDAIPEVKEYSNVEGEHVVGSALRLTRFGWTIVVEEHYADAFRPTLAVVRRMLVTNLATVLLFSGFAVLVARSIVHPIQALLRGAKRITDGDTDVFIAETSTHDELGVLTRSFNRMAQRLQRNAKELHEGRLSIEAANVRLRGQNEELQRMNEALEQLSITDGLTKLYNHRFFQENLTREIARVERSGAALMLILIDIDNFKHLNDRYGHAAGDHVLCEVARVMSGIVRESDVLARYGGEEFALVPSEVTLDVAMGLAEKIRMAIAEEQMAIDDAGEQALVQVTVSIGVTAYRRDRKTFFNDADRALYRAKAAGKDCVIVETGDENEAET